MPRTKLCRMVEKDNKPNHPVNKHFEQEPAIGEVLAPAKEQPSPATFTQPVKGELKKLAGSPFMVDCETGLIYLEEKLLKAIKNA